MRRSPLIPRLTGVALAGIGLIACSSFAHAQSQRSGGGDSQRLTQQIQQVASERAAALADAAKAKESAATLAKQLAQVTAERDALKGRLAAAVAGDSREKAAAQELDSTKARLAELVSKFKETASTLREVEGGRNQARAELETSRRENLTCAERNVELAGLASEALDRYAATGKAARAMRAEPFTGIARARAQNIADEYRAHIADLRVPALKQNTAPAGPSPAGDSTLPH
jgi:chromosome segregation ATPase